MQGNLVRLISSWVILGSALSQFRIIHFPGDRPKPSAISQKISALRRSPLPQTCGDPFTFGAQPWIAKLVYQTGFGSRIECMGVLIDKRYVLTTATCLSPNKILTKVILGEGKRHSRKHIVSNASGGDVCSKPLQEVGIKSVVVSPGNPRNSIGLIRLRKTMDFENEKNCNIQPICLPSKKFKAVEKLTQGNLVGAGLRRFPAPTSNENLKEASSIESFGIPTMSSKECETKFGQKYFPIMHICAKDTCLLPGSPLVWPGKVNKIIGLASDGEVPCRSELTPSLYLSVGFFKNWITRNIFP